MGRCDMYQPGRYQRTECASEADGRHILENFEDFGLARARV